MEAGKDRQNKEPTEQERKPETTVYRIMTRQSQWYCGDIIGPLLASALSS
jgi:hypothetical protein